MRAAWGGGNVILLQRPDFCIMVYSPLVLYVTYHKEQPIDGTVYRGVENTKAGRLINGVPFTLLLRVVSA
ncbi:hypothetical protein TNCV_1257521 [Trichonephila clavipes]|nr:hypothetical protein TNCV_1257521 [Trichonephila clavipes]